MCDVEHATTLLKRVAPLCAKNTIAHAKSIVSPFFTKNDFAFAYAQA